MVAEATLYLKGTTLRAREASPDLKHSINLISDELARQVKRHRDKRRRRREARAGEPAPPPPGARDRGPGRDRGGLVRRLAPRRPARGPERSIL